MEYLLGGFATVLQPMNILMMLIGALLGMIIGIVPGIAGPMGVALIIPFTFTMEPIQGILIMLTLYVTSTYGGSITAILFKIPGEAPSIVTTFDGYEMAKKGEAGKALGVAMFSSFLGGVFGVVVLMLVAPQLSTFALTFGDAEYFAISVLGLSVCAGMGGGSALKNILSAMAGLFLATWGLHESTGAQRFTFDSTGFLMGISFVPAILGLFAVGEVFEEVEKTFRKEKETLFKDQEKVRLGLPPLRDLLGMKWLYLRSMLIGTFLGTLPGVGGTTASFFGYSEAIRWSKHPEKFGTGIIEGIAAPESANNAACGGSMVPLLTLGIPGSATTAVMIGAFMIHGIRPGPMMIYHQPKLVYAIFAGLMLSNIFIILGGILGIRYLVKILDVPYSKVAPAILLFCVIGSYALNNSPTDVWVMFAFGVLGFLMRKFAYGLAPMVLGMILGPLCETSLQRAMYLADYKPLSLFTRPLSGLLLGLSILSFFYPLIRDFFKQRKKTMEERAA
ncbi:MAG: tripartite tricarboxylate transporter permease [Desulfobacterales bacterium]|nr:tripartite tricarboxylate transporter permease [Desulfobacterales bacterium]